MLFMFGFSELMAQKITQKRDVILVDNKPYLLISKQGGRQKTVLKIKTLDQKLIILATKDPRHSYYELTFMDTNEKAYFQAGFLTGISRKIAKELYNNNVVNGNAINEEGRKIFLIIYGQKPENLVENNYNYHRNREL